MASKEKALVYWVVLLVTLFLPAIAGAQVEEPPQDPDEVPACSGSCRGTSSGDGKLLEGKKCSDLSADERAAAITAACKNASTLTAEAIADDKCRQRGGENCVCDGSAGKPVTSFSDEGEPLNGCMVICYVVYSGTCKAGGGGGGDRIFGGDVFSFLNQDNGFVRAARVCQPASKLGVS